jgi:diguanylate cyclase (GGDEF)-like protein
MSLAVGVAVSNDAGRSLTTPEPGYSWLHPVPAELPILKASASLAISGIRVISSPTSIACSRLPVLALLLCLLFTAPVVFATVIIDGTTSELRPYAESSFLRDADGQLCFADVQRADAAFAPFSQLSSLNLGHTDDILWLHIPLRSELSNDSRWLLEMDYAYLDDLQLYVVRADGRVEQQQAGRHIPLAQWPLANRKPAFPLLLQAGESVTLYLRMKNHAAMALDMRLVSEPLFNLQDRRALIMLALYFGTLLALGAYNLLLYFSVRQPSFLLYSLFELSFGFAASSMNGIGPLLLWPAAGAAADFIVPVFFTLATALVVAVCWFVATLITLLVPAAVGLSIMAMTGILTTLSLLATGIAAMRLRIHASGIFVVAWFMLLLGTSLLSLRNAGVLPSNFLTVYGMQLGSALEMLLLSFALGARFNLLKKQKENVQQALVDTLREHERILEARVARRTEELLEAKARLEKMVTEDSLTGILNRLGLGQYYRAARKRALRSQTPLAVMLVDLDGFKPVNDQFGHEAGDVLLTAVAQRMAAAVRETDAVGRIGGDEFVLILEGCAASEIEGFAQRLLAAINEPMDIGDQRTLTVEASIGVYFALPEDEQLKTILRHADDAMYQVKRGGKNGVAVVFGEAA